MSLTTILLLQNISLWMIFLQVDASLPKSELRQDLMNLVRCKLAPYILPIFQTEDKTVNYLLYTRDNPNDPCDLQPTEEALNKCPFDPSHETKVIVHGWVSKLTPEDLKLVMKDKYLQVGDYNVVVFNWTHYTQFDSNPIGYVYSSLWSWIIGFKIAAWINFLQENSGASPETFHFLPHSLGCEVVSFTAKMACHLGHITYMDVAGPIFRFLPSFLTPTYTDAEFVEAIHTNGATNALQGFGKLAPLADIDYYPNGGSSQPKCYDGAEFQFSYGTTDTVHSRYTKISCNHYSVYNYYIASFNKSCAFLGLICNSYENFENGKCNTDNSVICKMGYDSIRLPGLKPKSKCYLETSDHYPYCLGIAGL